MEINKLSQLKAFKRYKNNNKKYLPFRCNYCSNILRIKICDEIKEIKLLISCKCGLISKCKYDTSYKSSYSFFSFDNGCPYKCIKCKKYLNTKTYLKKHYIKKHHLKKNEINNLIFKDNICKLHNQKYIAFCRACNIDICQKCIEDKKHHMIILYKDIIPNPEEFINKYNEIEKSINNTINALKVYGEELNYLIEKYEKILRLLRIFYFNFSCKINELNFALIHNIKENFDINYFNLDDLEKINQYDIKNLSALNNNKFFLYENDENENNNSKYDKRFYIKKMMIDLKTIYKIELTNIHKYLYIKDEKNILNFMILNLLNYYFNINILIKIILNT